MGVWYVQLGLCTVAVLVALGGGVGALRRRATARAGGPLAVVMFSLAAWSSMLLAQHVLPAGRAESAAVLGRLLSASVLVAAFYCETRALGDVNWRPSTRGLAALAVDPVLVLVGGLTNPLHHALFVDRATPPPPELGITPWGSSLPGPLLWVHVTYCYVLLLGCCLVLIKELLTASTQLQWRQLASVVITALLPTTGTMLSLARPMQPVAPTITPMLVILACLVHYWSVLRLGRLHLLPVARGMVLEHVGDAIFVLDPGDHVVDLNPAAEDLARRLRPDLPRDVVGLPCDEVLPPLTTADGEEEVPGPTGPLVLDLRTNDLADRHGRSLGRAVVVRDITELHEQRRRLAEVNRRLRHQLQETETLRRHLAEQALRDDLTGLRNRRYLLAELEGQLGGARSRVRPLSLLLLDIDHFKSVNDRNGHAIGDQLLISMARALTECLRTEDTVARYGGEEFVVLLPGTSQLEAGHLAEMLRARCATVSVDGRYGPVSTTVSAGVATFPACGWTGPELLQVADEALYAAKRAGRDRVICAPVS